ncbi:MAG: alkaline phosphatase D family protein [Gammaproteobacteria bacterium]|nr:alkaline phosphatase D family protein [Gammaproteobacteria bacterium]
MPRQISRRQALIGFSSTLLLPAACSRPDDPSGSSVVFAHGVASGDPDQTSVVIWTRISGIDSAADVDWQVARDSAFADVVSSGRAVASTARDYTVKVVAENLTAGEPYFYRFEVDGQSSPVGQTKTLSDGHMERLVIAVASCSNYPFGYFNAYEAIANDPDIDVVAHLGDYIYEYSEDGYGGETGKRINRVHEPRHEIVSLDDYRTRHAQYKSDAGSRSMHGRHPLIVIWDDHESANNPWMEGAENHQANEGDWFDRRAASLQAYFEWMPVRDPDPGQPLENYWRHYRFGDLASLVTLESRHTGRSEQIYWGDLNRFESAEDAQAFYRDVIGAGDRNFLSADMEAFLAASLTESVQANRRWRIIGNQSVMAKWRMPPMNDPFFAELRNKLDDEGQRTVDSRARMGELGMIGDLDAWNGYPVARERFYGIAKDAGATDLLVISGDSHSYWANALHDDNEQSMGVELGTTGITSPRSLLAMGLEGLERYDQLIADANREVVWAEGRYRGFIRLELDHDGARADYVTVTNIESRDYDTEIVYTANIVSENGELRYL